MEILVKEDNVSFPALSLNPARFCHLEVLKSLTVSSRGWVTYYSESTIRGQLSSPACLEWHPGEPLSG